MNKRGDIELILREVIFLILISVITISLFIFIHIQSKGYTMKEQALSKQAALLIDSARSGTILYILIGEIYNFKIDTEKKEIFVQAIQESKGKSYPYFSSYVIKFEMRDESAKDKLAIIQIK